MSQKNKEEHVAALLADLNGGVFLGQIDAALRETAIGVATTGKKGKVTITLDLERIAESNQVQCDHKITFVRPTTKGKKTEEDTTTTPLYVSSRGQLSLYPEQHQQPMFNPDGGRRSETDKAD